MENTINQVGRSATQLDNSALVERDDILTITNKCECWEEEADCINIKKIRDSAVIPTKGSKQAAGYDLYADIPDDILCIPPGKNALIGTGIAIELPSGYFGAVFARSGLALRQQLRPSNCVGVIDPDYRGEIKVALHNDSMEYEAVICSGDRIAQLVIIPFQNVSWNIISKLNSTDRGEGGFGSTGKD